MNELNIDRDEICTQARRKKERERMKEWNGTRDDVRTKWTLPIGLVALH